MAIAGSRQSVTDGPKLLTGMPSSPLERMGDDISTCREDWPTMASQTDAARLKNNKRLRLGHIETFTIEKEVLGEPFLL